MTTETKDHNSESQAFAQLESVLLLVEQLEHTENRPDGDSDKARQAIEESPLSLQVRSDWESPSGTLTAAEFEILLCTGGPAVRIVGDLDEHAQPDSAAIEHQDWGTPWKPYYITGEQETQVLTYCRQFYFGRG